MMHKLVVEFIGTLIFIIIILATGNPLAIAVGLAAMIYLGQSISGGNFNPAVSFASYMNGSLNVTELSFFILVQLLAAFAAYHIYKKYYVKY